MARQVALLIDGNNYVHRGYWAVPAMSSPAGIPVNAVAGFFKILQADIYHLNPTHLAVSFDRTPSHRRLAAYPEYKGTRKRDENYDKVRSQIRIVRQILRAAGIPTIGVVGDETDDVIATLSVRLNKSNVRVLISSTDKDYAQLVNEKTFMVEAKTRRILDVEAVITKYGVRPNQIPDYLALVGDTADNVPGVRSIGPARASALLQRHGSIKKAVASGEYPVVTQAWEDGTVQLSQYLVRMFFDVKIKGDASRFDRRLFDTNDVILDKICSHLGIKAVRRDVSYILSH